MIRLVLVLLAFALLGGGAFAGLYAYISFTDPQFRNRPRGYIFSVVGGAALGGFVALWVYLR